MFRISLLALLSLGSCASSPAVAPYDASAATRDGFELVRLEDGAQIAYRRLGAGAPLLVAAGSLLGPDLEALAAGRELVLFDAVGQGRSSPVLDLDRVRFERDVRDLEALRAHLGLERVSLLGWSYQAAVAARYALQYPQHVDKLVLVGPLPLRRDPFWVRFGANVVRRLDDEGTARIASLREEGLDRRSPEQFCDEFVAVFFAAYVVDPTVLQSMRGEPCPAPNNEPDFSAQVAALRLEKLGNWDWRHLLARLKTPTLLVHGAEAPVPVESAEEWAAILPDARLLVVPESGHMPWLERPDVFFDPVAEFLAED